MILRNRIQELTVDEIGLLCVIIERNAEYAINFTETEICWLNHKWVYARLNEAKDKLRDEFKVLVDQIIAKLFNS